MRRSRPIASPAVLVMLALALPLPAAAGTLVVSSPADSGPGSLRRALQDALPGDTIEFAPQVRRIALTGGELLVDKDLVLRGPAAGSPQDQLVLDGQSISRIFRIERSSDGSMPAVLLSDLAMVAGFAEGGCGGAILNEGDLTLVGCTVSDSVASAGPEGGGNGGGICNRGLLRVEASTVCRNRADGSKGAEDCGNGGGLYNGWDGAHPLVPRMTLANSTVSGNGALGSARIAAAGPGAPSAALALGARSGLGGGVFNDTRHALGAWGVEAVPGMVEAHHCTVAFNTAASGGGAAGFLLMENEAVGPDEALGGSVALHACIVSNNATTATDGSAGILGDALSFDSVLQDHQGELGGRGNLLGLDAGLLPLAPNGGPTLTHAIAPWSPAINAGKEDPGFSADQTGSPRVVSGRADSGSWEHALAPLPLGGGRAAKFLDRNGESVLVLLVGPGEGFVTAADGADAADVVLEGTTGASDLFITTSGSTSIRDILVRGRLNTLLAPCVDLLGEVSVTGGIARLVMRDVPGSGLIVLGTGGKSGARLEFRAVSDLTLRAEGRIRKLEAESWTGRGDGVYDLLQAPSVGRLQIAGPVSKLRVVSEGNIETVEVGSVEDSYFLAGTDPGLIGLADPRGDLLRLAKIKEFSVTGTSSGAEGYQFDRGILAASTLGHISLGKVRHGYDGPRCGLSAHAIHRLEFELGGQPYRYKNLKTAAQSLRHDRFTVSLDTTEDLGFSFCALDDTRGDLWLPGVALSTLGYLFQKASEDHCRFVLMPGDLAAGYMGLCMSDAACALFDPDGSLSRALSDQQYPEILQLAAAHGYAPSPDPAQGAALFVTRGNHECYLKGDLTRTQWTRYVGRLLPQDGPTRGAAPDQNPQMDERGFTYSFRYQNALFLGLDEYAALDDKDNGIFPPPSTAVPSVFCSGWLAGRLEAYRADSSLEHCFVFGHSPLYQVKMDTSMDATALTAAGRDAFLAEAGSRAEIYFTGHEHFYDHTVIAGTSLPGGQGIDALHQVLVGTGGAEIDRRTEEDCAYSSSYVRDPDRQYYHNPEEPPSGDPVPYVGYNLVTVNGPSVEFQWKSWRVDNPCHSHILPIPCTLCPWCTVSPDAVSRNTWQYSVQRLAGGGS